MRTIYLPEILDCWSYRYGCSRSQGAKLSNLYHYSPHGVIRYASSESPIRKLGTRVTMDLRRVWTRLYEGSGGLHRGVANTQVRRRQACTIYWRTRYAHVPLSCYFRCARQAKSRLLHAGSTQIWRSGSRRKTIQWRGLRRIGRPVLDSERSLIEIKKRVLDCLPNHKGQCQNGRGEGNAQT